MKINSHLIALVVVGGGVLAWILTRPKVLEQADGWTYCQKGSKFYAFFGSEGGTIPNDTRSPDLDSLNAVKAWVVARRAGGSGIAKAASIFSTIAKG